MNAARVTRRGWTVVAIALVVLTSGLYVGYRAFFGGHDCEVTIAGTTVDVARDAAERAATAVAAPSPRSVADAKRRVEKVTDLSGEDGPWPDRR